MRTEYRATSRRGVALVVVLLIISVVAAIIFEFGHDSYVEFQLADNVHKSYQALHCAEAGLAIAASLLERPDNAWADEESVRILTGATSVPIGDGFCTIKVVGEGGKINVNGMISRDGQLAKSRVDQMLRLIDVLNAQYSEGNPISYGIVPAIIDWIDQDDEVTVLPSVRGENTGAESSYYQHHKRPYRCKNKPLDVLGELLLIRGVTSEILLGAAKPGKEGLALGMKDFLTVYGEGRLSINQVSVSVLMTLSDDIDKALAEAIVRHRPYRSLRELSQVPGMTSEALTAIREGTTVRADDAYYTVTAKGVAGQCVRTIRVVVSRDSDTGQFRPFIRWEL